MFGVSYQWNMALEIFLRYLEPGIHDIETIRKALGFIPDQTFVEILKTASERGLISINPESKRIFVRQKTVDVIRFVEKYDFINELQKHKDNEDYRFGEELEELLKKVNYFTHKFHNVQTELINCMKLEKNDDYSSEILCFEFQKK